eukprot:CAMPEP_0185438682 /NCGR_PEP_ID=MMETSP1365-20130426/35476_1 /TAXON_ID=38817 /ORGANISM="Gephyrocapsa oceanica, Strain RCC1303" /LENGTH=91 /DNA_ID=CAMNT_0028043901 /DNA_START=118 /DNA_END=389 /DNA_ORIENTATION=+
MPQCRDGRARDGVAQPLAEVGARVPRSDQRERNPRRPLLPASAGRGPGPPACRFTCRVTCRFAARRRARRPAAAAGSTSRLAALLFAARAA